MATDLSGFVAGMPPTQNKSKKRKMSNKKLMKRSSAKRQRKDADVANAGEEVGAHRTSSSNEMFYKFIVVFVVFDAYGRW